MFGVGNELANVITGNEVEILLIGGAGDDALLGGAGNNSLFGEAGGDQLCGNKGIDYIVGGDGNDVLDGGDYVVAFYGGAGDEEIYEGYWFFTDIFVGSAGNDVLFGEAGTDTFLFEQGTGGVVIADFIQGEDTIDISAFDFASFEALQTTFVQNGDVGAINLGNGDFLVFHNVVLDDLVEGDFLL